jgi:hypothetical protein
MCGRYSEYEIATYGSLLVQVIFYFGTSVPGFIFQFLAFMKKYKVQQVRRRTARTGRGKSRSRKRGAVAARRRVRSCAEPSPFRECRRWAVSVLALVSD